MKIVLPGFVEPTKLYSLSTTKDNVLVLTKLAEHDGLTLGELGKLLREETLNGKGQPRETVLIDSAHPDIINELKNHGLWVIGGRL